MSIVACRVDGKGYTVAADSITVYGPHANIYRELMLDGDGILAPSIGDGEIMSYGAFPVSNHRSNLPNASQGLISESTNALSSGQIKEFQRAWATVHKVSLRQRIHMWKWRRWAKKTKIRLVDWDKPFYH